MILDQTKNEKNGTIVLNQQIIHFRLESEDVIVHFNLHFNPALGPIDPLEVEEVILKEIEMANVTGSVLDQVVIDKESLAIQGKQFDTKAKYFQVNIFLHEPISFHGCLETSWGLLGGLPKGQLISKANSKLFI